MATQPLIVIVGPTASGKTALAVEMAQRYDGEIICADSRTVYKGMDIGTAKPTLEEQARVRHWGIDLVDPDQRFTAADFQKYVYEKVDDIRRRGKIPFLVGGTGLYVDAVVFEYHFGEKPSEQLRSSLQSMSLNDLYTYCDENNIKLPENSRNKRYVVRAIEQKSINNMRRERPIEDCYIVGIATEKSILMERIQHRSEQIFGDNVLREASKLANKYGWEHESMSGNIYPLCRQVLDGSLSLSDAKKKFVTLDWRLAKRQMTWLKRNRFVQWGSLEESARRLQQIFESEH